MDLSVETFNRAIKELGYEGFIPSIDTLEYLNDTVNGMNIDIFNLYNLGRRSRGNTLTIYYPISRYDEFPPIGVSYDSSGPVSPKSLFENIQAFYRQPLSRDNILAYVQAEPEIYDFLQDESRPALRDAMIELVNIEGLTPYENGYLLNLGS